MRKKAIPQSSAPANRLPAMLEGTSAIDTESCKTVGSIPLTMQLPDVEVWFLALLYNDCQNYRGLNNYRTHTIVRVPYVVIVQYTPKPYSKYLGPYIT